MQYCAVCLKLDTCQQTCPSVEKFLNEGTRYQRERVVSAESLEHFYLKALENGLISTGEEENLSQEPYFPDESIQKNIEHSTLLNRRQQYVLKLYLRGKTHAEIAEKMGVSRQNISKSLKRIKEKLKKRLPKLHK